MQNSKQQPEKCILISDICNKVKNYLAPEQVNKIYNAYLVAVNAHDGQYRQSGEAYVFHPLSVAMILVDLKVDVDSIVSAILHDCIEDTIITKKEITQQFGTSVAHIVDGVSKLEGLENKSINEKQAKNFRKLLLAASKDIRVIVIKLADRLHNMRTINSIKRERQIRIARETDEVYIPISRRIGMGKVTKELRILVFKTIRPLRYQVLSAKLQEKYNKNKHLLEVVIKTLTQQLNTANIQGEIHGRTKDLVSVYHKMRNKKIHFVEVFDLYGLRIVVNSVSACYKVLGIVHNTYKPIPGKFKDYIALPKNNGYQSLHTIIFGNNKQTIEVQIRSLDMENVAAYGLASHWYYKNNHTKSLSSQWIGSLVDKNNKDNDEIFLERAKAEMSENDIFVFTPAGDIIKLPYKATVLDFAYCLHTDIGNMALRAKIDNINTGLANKIKSGQTIEIITAKKIMVEISWLEIVTTIKAKIALKNTLKTHFKKNLVNAGRVLLADILYYNGINIEKINNWNVCFKPCLVKNKQALLIKIALKEILISKVIGLLVDDNIIQVIDDDTEHLQGIKTVCAKCCYPIPGDEVVGILGINKGLQIHQKNCVNIKNKDICVVDWRINKITIFTARIICDISNKRGTLASILNIINKMKINISKLDIKEQSGNFLLELLMDVNSLKILNKVIKKLKKSKFVEQISRV